MRFTVVQIGARHGYAVPVILEKAGMLERFYTDVAANVGAGRWLVRCGALLGCRDVASRLANRRVPESIRAKTATFVWPTFCFASKQRLHQNNSGECGANFRAYLQWSGALGRAMTRRGFGRATHLYSMLGECGPMLTEAKRRGLGVVTEVYILLSTEHILAEERKAFGAWEAPQTDLNLIREEFPQERDLAMRTDFAVCPSDAVRRDLQDNFSFPPGRSAVVPYGVDVKWLELPSQPKAGRVLFVGTAGLRKGIHYLALAADRLRAQGRNYEFRIAGDVTQRIAGQPECRHLTFLGRVPRDRMQQEYASADIFVLPSLAEGSAESIYEALACGLPVITTDAAGSVARDQIEGSIVPERDPLALAVAVERTIENRQLRTTMAAAARERARDYTLQRYGARLESALRSFEK